MGHRKLRSAASGKHAEWAFMKRFEVPSFDEPDVNYMTRRAEAARRRDA